MFLIAGLAGYTVLTAAHGGLEAAKVVGRYVELAERALVPGARIAERVGDQLLVVADEPHAAIRSAIRLRDAIEADAYTRAIADRLARQPGHHGLG